MSNLKSKHIKMSPLYTTTAETWSVAGSKKRKPIDRTADINAHIV